MEAALITGTVRSPPIIASTGNANDGHLLPSTRTWSGSTDNVTVSSNIVALKDVYYIDSENKTYLYMSGKFDDSNAAVEHKNKLVEMGYKDAFIVKLNNK